MATGTGSPEVVLIVDSFDGREMYTEYFESQGLAVQSAATPDEALQLLDQVRPAVVVTDLIFHANHMDACTFMSAVRRHPDLELTSIIVVTGYVREGDRQHARRCGADVFCIKPCLPQTLLAHVKHALVSRRRGRRLTSDWASRDLDRRRSPRARPDGRRREPIMWRTR